MDISKLRIRCVVFIHSNVDKYNIIITKNLIKLVRKLNATDGNILVKYIKILTPNLDENILEDISKYRTRVGSYIYIISDDKLKNKIPELIKINMKIKNYIKQFQQNDNLFLGKLINPNIKNKIFCFIEIGTIYKYRNLFMIWNGQRKIDTDRVIKMVSKYNETKIDINGSIILAFYDGNLEIVDGNHRFQSIIQYYRQLPERGKKYICGKKICFEIIKTENRDETFELFEKINKSVPVPLCYLKTDIMVDKCSRLLQKKYPKIFVDRKCQRPRISIPDMKSKMIKKHMFEELNISNPNEMFEIIKNLNEKVKRMSIDDFIIKYNIRSRVDKPTENQYNKCETFGYCYLGLFKKIKWIDILIRNNYKQN